MGHREIDHFLLNEEQLREFTGFERPTFQEKWLKQNGIQFYVGGDGKIKVLFAALYSKPAEQVSIQPLRNPQLRFR